LPGCLRDHVCRCKCLHVCRRKCLNGFRRKCFDVGCWWQRHSDAAPAFGEPPSMPARVARWHMDDVRGSISYHVYGRLCLHVPRGISQHDASRRICQCDARGLNSIVPSHPLPSSIGECRASDHNGNATGGSHPTHVHYNDGQFSGQGAQLDTSTILWKAIRGLGDAPPSNPAIALRPCMNSAGCRLE